MIEAVFLDSAPLGLVTLRARKSAEGDNCRAWLEALVSKGIRVYIPEIINYEVRRELLRANKQEGIRRLNTLTRVAEYLPVTTQALRLAAGMWADARQRGIITSHPKALDVDVILCAQALSLGIAPDTYVIATSNVSHLQHFAPAQEWEKIVL